MKNCLAAGAAAPLLPSLAAASRPPAKHYPDGCPAVATGSRSPQYRRSRAYRIRVQAAGAELRQPVEPLITNCDEFKYANHIGNYSKGLPHDALGEVVPAAYDAYLHASTTGSPADFENIPLGCSGGYKFVNPQAGLAYDLEGVDAAATRIPPPPALGSDEATAEMIELYWMALCRDIPFNAWDTDPLIQEAAADLTRLGDAFKGPKENGQVTPRTLFRESLPGNLVGPYNSQFRYLPVPFGANEVDQQVSTVLPGRNSDFMTDFNEWLSVENSCLPSASEQADPIKRYIRNGRDAAYWTHNDTIHQAYFMAMLTLLYPMRTDSEGGSVLAPLNPGNPYRHSQNQAGLVTFGLKHIVSLLPEVCDRALKAAWHQKWCVHRRVRPEEYGALIHKTLAGIKQYPVNTPLLLESSLFRKTPRTPDDPYYDLVFRKYGSYLLPQVFTEGCPLHPSYPSGHATAAGACVTILKAFFDESFVMPTQVVQPNADGTALEPYPEQVTLTLGGEANKLSGNVAQSRNIAGVHYRSDAYQGQLLGEAVAISILYDQKRNYNEDFQGFTFTKFDGTTVTV